MSCSELQSSAAVCRVNRMATIKRFEDLIAWQKARALAKEVYTITRTGTFAQDFGLRDQICRSAVSVMSNIAEGFEKDSRAEFHRYLTIAKGSCAEVRSQLYVALDVGHLQEGLFVRLQEQAEEVARIIGGLREKVGTMRPAGRTRG